MIKASRSNCKLDTTKLIGKLKEYNYEVPKVYEIRTDEAPDAYFKFDKRIEGYAKVLIHPNGPLDRFQALINAPKVIG